MYFSEQENRRQTLKEQSLPSIEENDKLERFVDNILSNHQLSDKQINSIEVSTAAISNEVNKNVDIDLSSDVLEMHNLGSTALLKSCEACDESITMNMEKVDQRASKNPSFSAIDWASNLANAAAGKMSTEVSGAMDANGVDASVFRSSHCLEQIPFTCDSFDAAIAAHISRHHKIGFAEPAPHLSSIWDAEETCDAFSFRNKTVSNNQLTEKDNLLHIFYLAMAGSDSSCEWLQWIIFKVLDQQLRRIKSAKVFNEEQLVNAIEIATGPKNEFFCFIDVIVHKDDTSKKLLEWVSRVSAANSRPHNQASVVLI